MPPSTASWGLRHAPRRVGQVELRYPNLYCFEALSRALDYRAYGALRGLDAWLYRRVPPLRPWSYHVLITAARPPAHTQPG